MNIAKIRSFLFVLAGLGSSNFENDQRTNWFESLGSGTMYKWFLFVQWILPNDTCKYIFYLF